MKRVTLYDVATGEILRTVSYPKLSQVPIMPGEAMLDGAFERSAFRVDVNTDPPVAIPQEQLEASVSTTSPSAGETFIVTLGQRTNVRVIDDVGDELLSQWVLAGEHQVQIADPGHYFVRFASPLFLSKKLELDVL